MNNEKYLEKLFFVIFISHFDDYINTLHSSNTEVWTVQTSIVNPGMLSLQGMLPEHPDALPTKLRGGLKLTHYPASLLNMTAAW